MTAASNLKAMFIASASSSGNRGMHDFSGETGRWKELTLYKTGEAISSVSRLTRRCGVGTETSLEEPSATTRDEVIDFFGGDWLAKQLYAHAEIDAAIDVESSARESINDRTLR